MTIVLVAPNGYVKHLAVWAYNLSGSGDRKRFDIGRWVPLCGYDRGRDWQFRQITDPAVWDFPVCWRCRARVIAAVDVIELDQYLKENNVRPPGEHTNTGEDTD